MKIGKACAIFMQIDSDKYTVEEKERRSMRFCKCQRTTGLQKAICFPL